MSLGVARDRAAADRSEAERATVELRALAHPIRLRILSLLTGAAMTAAEVARELNLNHANASYHLRQLHAAGAIEVAGEERIRGGAAKRYRYDVNREPPRPAKKGATAGAERRLVYAALATELRRRADHFRASPWRSSLTDAELWVDPGQWEAIVSRIGDLSGELHRAAKPPRTPGTIRVNATIALFEMEPHS
jgi:DNA-binding transcriptional ArsR family regulator